MSDNGQAKEIMSTRVKSSKSVAGLVLVAVLVLSGCVSAEDRFASIALSFDQSISEDDLTKARQLFEEAQQLLPGSQDTALLGQKLQTIEASRAAFELAERFSQVGSHLIAAGSYLEVSDEDSIRFESANTKLIAELSLAIDKALAEKDLVAQESALRFVAEQTDLNASRLGQMDALFESLAESYRSGISTAVNLAIRDKRLLEAETSLASAIQALPEDEQFKKLLETVEGLIKEQKRLEAEALERERKVALAAMFVKTDSFEGIDWYYDRATYSSYAGNKFSLYIGKRSFGGPWLILRMQYYGSDWVFWETLTISVDGEKFSISPGYSEVDRDNGGGDVWEWYDMAPSPANLEMIRKIINSNNTTLRFQGDTYRADRVLSSAQKRAFKNVLVAFEALGG